MDYISEVREEVALDPLKHLLSLDWNSSLTLTAIEKNLGASKSVKRVRFSDEVEKILYESSDEKNLDIAFTLEESSDDRNNDIEMNPDLSKYCNENKTNIFIDETEVTNFDDIDNAVDSVVNDINDNMPTTPVTEINISVQGDEDSVNENISQNSLFLVENYENEQSSVDLEEEVYDLNEVTKQVENLSLQNASSENMTSVFPVEPVSEPSHLDIYSVRNSINEDELRSNTNYDSAITLKRRVKSELYNQKQSWKLNSALTENSCYSSASELNSAVFKAWCNVKNKTQSVETAISKKGYVSNKPNTSNIAYLTWKKSKIEAQKKARKDKTSSNFLSMPQEVSKNSKEEIEMAFKAWKKKKDEILKQKMSQKFDKEQEKVVDSLMEKKEKMLEGEAALNAWKQHKTYVLKLQMKKRVWVMQKKREEEEKRITRDREALIVYRMWLESKNSVKHTFSPVKFQPPWLPPGK